MFCNELCEWMGLGQALHNRVKETSISQVGQAFHLQEIIITKQKVL